MFLSAMDSFNYTNGKVLVAVGRIDYPNFLLIKVYCLSCLCFQMGHLRKESDGSLLYTVVNQLDPDAEGVLSFHCLLNICTIFSKNM